MWRFTSRKWRPKEWVLQLTEWSFSNKVETEIKSVEL